MRRVAWCAVALLLTLAARGQDGDVLTAYRAAEASGAALLGPAVLDSVPPVDDPAALKRWAREQGLQLMGPGLTVLAVPCRTAAGSQQNRANGALRALSALPPDDRQALIDGRVLLLEQLDPEVENTVRAGLCWREWHPEEMPDVTGSLSPAMLAENRAARERVAGPLTDEQWAAEVEFAYYKTRYRLGLEAFDWHPTLALSVDAQAVLLVNDRRLPILPISAVRTGPHLMATVWLAHPDGRTLMQREPPIPSYVGQNIIEARVDREQPKRPVISITEGGPRTLGELADLLSAYQPCRADPQFSDEPIYVPSGDYLAARLRRFVAMASGLMWARHPGVDGLWLSYYPAGTDAATDYGVLADAVVEAVRRLPEYRAPFELEQFIGQDGRGTRLDWRDLAPAQVEWLTEFTGQFRPSGFGPVFQQPISPDQLLACQVELKLEVAVHVGAVTPAEWEGTPVWFYHPGEQSRVELPRLGLADLSARL